MGQFLDIAASVLRNRQRPMKPSEIVDAARDEGLFSDKLSGKTPYQTMKAKLSVDIRRYGEASRFMRTAPNTFYLRDLLTSSMSVYAALHQLPSWEGEDVLVFPSSILDEFGRFQGVSTSSRAFLKVLRASALCGTIPRFEAEQREDLKQLLTYVLVTCGKKVLCYRRGSYNRAEEYLRGSLCVGFGGHISQADCNLFNLGNFTQLAKDAAARELVEELQLPSADQSRLEDRRNLSLLGLLNDDSSATGRKHLAVILRYEVAEDSDWLKPIKGEKSINQLRWLDLDHFDAEFRYFEYWSQLCLTAFFPKVARAQPAFIVRRKSVFKTRHVLCIIGGIGSGKSAATRILSDEFDYVEINSGQVLSKLMSIPPVPQSDRAIFQSAAWKFIERLDGPRLLAKAILSEAKSVEGSVLVDGLRQKATISELRRQVAPERIALVYVYTPPNIAFQFYNLRADASVTIEQFLRLNDAPVESEIKKLIADADAILYNWSGKLEYEKAIRKFMQEVSE